MTKKEIKTDHKSRRQMWQTYQHALKTHEYFKECWKQIKKENDLLQVNDPARALERFYNAAMVDSWVLLNKIKAISRSKFNQDISALEVYK